MSSPYYTSGTPDTAPHTLQAPPSSSTLNQRVAEILATAASIYLAAKLIELLLRPFKVSIEAILPVLRMVNRGTAHAPRALMGGVKRTSPEAKLIRSASNNDLYFRAAYVVAASTRVQREIDLGTKPLPVILADESLNYRRHEAARNQRMKATRRTAVAAGLFGPVLGWYLNPLLNNEIECITANGNNFRADEPPKIGLPGVVHVGCGCYAGQPHAGAGWVNDAIDSLVKRGGLRLIRRKAS